MIGPVWTLGHWHFWGENGLGMHLTVCWTLSTHLLLDSCHLLKLAKNALWKVQVMFLGDCSICPVCLLLKIQNHQCLKFVNWLGAHQITFQQHVLWSQSCSRDYRQYAELGPGPIVVWVSMERSMHGQGGLVWLARGSALKEVCTANQTRVG